jgi:hypothetical protein
MGGSRMDIGPRSGHPVAGVAVGAQVRTLASQVISVLAERYSVTESQIRRELLLDLVETLVSDDVMAASRFLDDLRLQRIPTEALVDEVLPQAARALGEAWNADQISFVDVTIGAMRLQGMLRDIEGREGAGLGARGRPLRGSALVVVPSDEQHTLGALVLSNQLRRAGVSACLRIMPGTNHLRDLMAMRRFDTVLVSVSAGSNLDLAAKLVKFIRMIHKDAPQGAPPVIVGGAILQSGIDVKALTGADHVTNDPLEALRFCGIGEEGARRHQRV